MKKRVKLTEDVLRAIIRESLQTARDKVIKNLDNTSPKDTIKQISKFGILDDSSYVPQRKSELLRNDRIPKREISPEEEENARKHLSLNEAENGGWVVDDSEAQEAYNFAVDRMGKETVDTAIIRALSDKHLAEILAYIFRMYDFREWDEYKEGIGSEDGEDYIN